VHFHINSMRQQLSGEQIRQRSIEAELTKRRLQSRRFNMRGYSMNLRELPNDGTLAVESSKLIVKTVQNFKVLCHADSMIDDDDDMIESALLNLAASKRQKDRAPSSMILHRHMHNRNLQEFYPHQNSIVHQKLKGQTDSDNQVPRVYMNEVHIARPESALPILTPKIAVAPTFLQLFDLDSSRTGRTNECSVNYEQSSMRIEVYTPVRSARSARSVIEQHSWSDAQFGLAGPHMPAAMGKSRTPIAAPGAYNWLSPPQPASPVLELAAPYSKNYVENYKSKIRHSRLGPLFGQLRHVSTPKNAVRPEHVRNDEGIEVDTESAQHRMSTPDFPSQTFQRNSRLSSADSNLVSSPSEGSHVDYFERDSEMNARTDDSLIDASCTQYQEENTTDKFEEMERERMLEQVQKLYSDVPFDTSIETTGPKRCGLNSERDNRARAGEWRTSNSKNSHVSNASRRKGAEFKSLTVKMPHNEDCSALARDHLDVNVHSSATLKSKPSVKKPEHDGVTSQIQYRMSVNILRPFESIVDIAQRHCASTANNRVTKNQHATPVAVMLASPSLMI
jgi:hypothetical protein